MGNGMDKILPGLYVGNIRDGCDKEQIKNNNITHILSVHEDAKPGLMENVKYLCIKAGDNASQDLKQYFIEAIDFIHSARVNNGNVLVHCLAGVSRSATLAISYVMVVTSLPWYDSMNAARAARERINPNFGFQRQLQNFEFTNIKTVREDLFLKYGPYDNSEDIALCKSLLEKYQSKQEEFSQNSNNQQQISAGTIKTYPLAFNSYNLDKEKVKNTLKVYKKKNRVVEQSEVKETDDKKEAKNEKEIIMDKIFS
ncbi:unnamed protein product [Brachionus calyciflorus]|uniref:Dual specificity protein phosphatase 15 n=1 Tax=Brachionus calyciflorus TaxID=104777 RepID=A0A814JCM9_9BILA|nr:unnamed protein product [Brachionus calyciflorus]